MVFYYFKLSCDLSANKNTINHASSQSVLFYFNCAS